MTTEELKRFEIPGRVTVLEGSGDLPKLEVKTDWSTAEIYLHGAHVTSWQTPDSAEIRHLQFTTPRAKRNELQVNIAAALMSENNVSTPKLVAPE